MLDDPIWRRRIIIAAIVGAVICLCCGVGFAGYVLITRSAPIFGNGQIFPNPDVPEVSEEQAGTIAADLNATSTDSATLTPTEEDLLDNPPTDTPTPTATATSALAAAIEDSLNDLFDCATGELFGTPADEVDALIDALIIDPVSQTTPDEFVIDVQMAGQVSAQDFLDAGIFFAGGLGTVDSTQPFPPGDPNWFFESVDANVGYNWQLLPDGSIQTYVARFGSDGWSSAPDPRLVAAFEGGDFVLNVPVDLIPPGAQFWYISFTNFTACDEVGLDPATRSMPMVPFPGALGIP